MNRLERIESLPQLLITAMQGWQSDMWTAIPALVKSFDPVLMTCEVQPTIRFRITYPALNTYTSPTMTMDESGQFAWDKIPLLLDCPVVFPCGGGVTMTFPIQPNDEVLVVLASRCIDAWWDQGGIQNQTLLRMHDLSDGFVLPGVRSKPRVIPSVSTTSAQFRSDDGQTFVEINPSNHQITAITPSNIVANAGANVSVTAGGYISASASGDITATSGASISATAAVSATVKAPGITLDGSVNITGALTVAGATALQAGATITGSMSNNGVNIGSTHVHSGVQSGSSNTGAPQ